MSRSFFGSFAKGTFGSIPNVRCSPSSISVTKRLSPFAHGATAPSASDFESSGTMRAGSKS